MRDADLLKVFSGQAIAHDKKSDKHIWISSAFCAKVVARDAGKQIRGATLGLADDMGRSPDTIEDRAHGYWLFEELCKLDNGQYRNFVFLARRAPYIHFSHFRALWDVKNTYKLSHADCLSLLTDIVQHEGALSSRKLEEHTRTKFGDTRDWTYYGQRAMKEISKTLTQPDTPAEVRKVLQDAFSILGDEA